MLKERDHIDRLICDKLYNARLTPPEDGWSRLEQSLYGRKKKMWWPYVAAAAAVILLLLTVTLNVDVRQDEPLAVGDTPQQSIEWNQPEVASVASEQPIESEPTVETPRATTPATNRSLVASHSVSQTRQQFAPVDVSVAQPATHDSSTDRQAPVQPQPTPQTTEPSSSHEAIDSSQSQPQVDFDLDAYARSLENESLPVLAEARSAKNRWNVGVYAGNQNGFGTTPSSPTGGAMQNSSAHSLAIKNTTLFFQEDLRRGEVQPVKFKHNMPLSVGATVRKHFTRRFAVETGLTYTYLGSNGKVDGKYGYTIYQYLHYLGIPVTANYTFVSFKGFSFYGAAGGAIERCIASERKAVHTQDDGTSKSITTGMEVTDLDLSLTAKLGVSYDLGKHVGLSFEPLLNYYFMGSEKVDSYRKENPVGLSLRLGVYARF